MRDHISILDLQLDAALTRITGIDLKKYIRPLLSVICLGCDFVGIDLKFIRPERHAAMLLDTPEEFLILPDPLLTARAEAFKLRTELNSVVEYLQR